MRPSIIRLVNSVWIFHALYNIIGGLWAVLHLRSLEAVTGPKKDHWLVRTVGALLTVIGVATFAAGSRKRITPEVASIASASAASLATVDIVYVSKRRISRVYLLDALAELLLVAGWILYWRSNRHSPDR